MVEFSQSDIRFTVDEVFRTTLISSRRQGRPENPCLTPSLVLKLRCFLMMALLSN